MGALFTRSTNQPERGNNKRRKRNVARQKSKMFSINMGNRDYDTDTRLYKVIHDYSARGQEDLSVKVGDQVEVIDKSNPGWWRVKALGTGSMGYIPSNYIAKQESIQSEPWFFEGMTRINANLILKAPDNALGSFLVRRAETRDPNEFTLSALGPNGIVHYKIQVSGMSAEQPSQLRYFIKNAARFDTVKELVSHYQRNTLSEKMEFILTEPCITVKQAPETMGLAHDQWEIMDRSLLTRVKQIGSGQYGEVWEGRWNGSKTIAIKEMRKGCMTPSEFVAEANVMKTLNHRNLLGLVSVSTTKEPILIITELMVNGALHKYLMRRDQEKDLVRVEDLINMAAQVADGMAYLDMKKFVHRDLAARNVLVGKNYHVKVADFGLARLITKGGENAFDTSCKFAVKWTAPEAFLGNFSIKSDVWSFGILLSEIITHGKQPYPHIKNEEIYQKISEQDFRMERMRGCPEKLYDIMKSCWNKVPCNRPQFESLCDQLENYIGEIYGEYQYQCPDCVYLRARGYVETGKCKSCKKLEQKNHK